MKVSPVADATFLVVGQRNLLFSEAAQRFYELNDVGAFIWCSLHDGEDPPRVASELGRRGIEPAQADAFVRSAVSGWLEAGLVRLSGSDESERPAAREMRIALADIGVPLRFDSDLLAEAVLPVFGHLEGAGPTGVEPIDLTRQGEAIRIAQGGRVIAVCRDDEAAAGLKAHLTQLVLERSALHIVLHAACLVHRDRCLLLIGRPGAGKTTLTLALAASGLGYAGDDMALVTPEGTVRGVPFAAAVKSGAWPIVSRFAPDFATAPIHWRADRKRVRYVTPRMLATQAARPVGWVMFLDRQAERRAALAPVDPAETLTRLVGHAYTPDHRLTVRGAHALAGLARNAEAFDLAYSDLDEAVDVIGRALS